MSGRPKIEIELSSAEHERLRAWTRSPRTGQALAMRARIILLCGEGLDHKTIAAMLDISEQTVSKWRKRFLAQRVDGLSDAPRPGAPPRIDRARAEAIIARTRELQSAGELCTTRGVAREAGVSHTAVSQIWRQAGLLPLRPRRPRRGNAAGAGRTDVPEASRPPAVAPEIAAEERSAAGGGDS